MPVSPLDGPPFRGRHATTLTRIVGTVRSVLDPDSVEMEYLFEPSGQRFRWRALRSRVFTAGTVRPARRHSAPVESLAVEFHLTGLLRGALTLLRGPRRPWTQPEVLRFEDLPPGSLASRRAIVRWSDGSEGEAVRFYADEVLSPVDHGGRQ